MRKRVLITLDDDVPAEGEFLKMLEQLPKARRSEWFRLVIRAGVTTYRDNLGKPGFGAFHEARENGKPVPSAEESGGLAAKVVPSPPESPTVETLSPQQIVKSTPPLMDAGILRGMFKVSSAAEQNAEG